MSFTVGGRRPTDRNLPPPSHRCQCNVISPIYATASLLSERRRPRPRDAWIQARLSHKSQRRSTRPFRRDRFASNVSRKPLERVCVARRFSRAAGSDVCDSLASKQQRCSAIRRLLVGLPRFVQPGSARRGERGPGVLPSSEGGSELIRRPSSVLRWRAPSVRWASPPRRGSSAPVSGASPRG
jgi:hypothetical protein